jgi:hypothetical protein
MKQVFICMKKLAFRSAPNKKSISGERFSVLRQTIFKSQPDEKAFPKSLNLERSLPPPLRLAHKKRGTFSELHPKSWTLN